MIRPAFFASFALLALLLFSSQSFAWSVFCHIDKFSDRRSCHLSDTRYASEAKVVVKLHRSNFFLWVGDQESRYEMRGLIRVDNLEVRDLATNLGGKVDDQIGMVMFDLNNDYGVEVMRELVAGNELSVRLFTIDGYQTFTVSLAGFKASMQELVQKSGIK